MTRENCKLNLIRALTTTNSVPSTKKLTTEKCKQQAKMHQNKNFHQKTFLRNSRRVIKKQKMFVFSTILNTFFFKTNFSKALLKIKFKIFRTQEVTSAVVLTSFTSSNMFILFTISTTPHCTIFVITK